MGTVDLSKVSYKTDFRLIHKHEEAKYSQRVEGSLPRDVKIYPQTMDMPPLLKVWCMVRVWFIVPKDEIAFKGMVYIWSF